MRKLRLAAFWTAVPLIIALATLPVLGQGVGQVSVGKTSGSGGGGTATAVTPGVTTITGCTNKVVIADGSSTLNCDADLAFTTDTLTVTKIVSSGLVEFSGQTNVSGPDATTNIEIGSTANDANAGTGGTSTVIGNSAANGGNATGAVVIGSGATNPGAASDAIVIGRAAANTGAGANNILIGQGATNDGSNNTISIGAAANGKAGIAIGTSVVASTQAIAIGQTLTTSANTFVAGGNAFRMADVYFGAGITSTTAAAWTLHGVGGSGADNAGGNLLLASGSSTGTGRSGDVIIQTAPSTGTSSTLNTLADRIRVIAKAVTVTDAATTIFQITGLGAHVRAGGVFEFCVQASDGTNDQVACGRTYWGAVDTTAGAGGEVCTNLVDGLTISAAASGAASSGTLVITADATTGTDLCNVRITPAGSLTETTYNVTGTVFKYTAAGTIVPQ